MAPFPQGTYQYELMKTSINLNDNLEELYAPNKHY